MDALLALASHVLPMWLVQQVLLLAIVVSWIGAGLAAAAKLQRAGFALPVVDVERLTVRYDNAFALMQDLRRMGATNLLVERRKAPTRRATLLRMAQVYGERFADADGRIRATFDIVWLLGWAPHESQPRPLRPGSAKFSLEAAVKGRKP